MSESPYELQRLVVVATFSSPWEAQIAQTRLGAEGLHSLIADEHLIRLVALSNAIGGIHLKVREGDAAAAAEVLRRLVPLPEIYLIEPTAPDAPEGRGEADGPGAAIAGAGPAGRAGWSALGGRLERTGRAAPGELLGRAAPGERLGRVAPEERFGRAAPGERFERAAPPGPAEPPEIANPDHAPLTTAARFHTPWEAHLARTLLESEGVRCCVLEERMPAVHMLSAEPAAFNRLEVHQADAARAAAILARAFSSPSLVAVPDPDADADADPDADPELDPGPGTQAGPDSGGDGAPDPGGDGGFDPSGEPGTGPGSDC
jgi:hypothetical protein